MKLRTAVYSVLTLPLTMAAFAPAFAQQSGDGLSAEQLEDIKSVPGLVLSGNDNVKLTLSGQVNRGVLYFDDGKETGSIHVDNDNSSTRIRLGAETTRSGDLKFGSLIELQYESNSTASVDQENQRNVGPNTFTERKLEVFGQHARLGRITLGQGDTASNGTSEQDLSGTTVIGYSGVSDLGGGLRFRDRTDALTDTSVGNTFSNFDGLSRDDRLRYDSPVIGGAVVSASIIADDRWDIAAKFSGEFGNIKTSAALSYADVGEELDNRINGSASVLLSNGFSVSIAAGQDDRKDNRDPQFAYVKAGYQAKWGSFGVTALSIDYYEADDVAAIDDESTSIGFQVVQNIDSYGAELYAGLRNYELDSGETNGFPVDDVFAGLAGVRLKF